MDSQCMTRAVSGRPVPKRVRQLRDASPSSRVPVSDSSWFSFGSAVSHALAVVAGMGIMVWYDSLAPEASLPEQMKGILPRLLDRDTLGDDGFESDSVLNSAFKTYIPSDFDDDEENEAHEAVRGRLKAHMPRFFHDDDDDDDDDDD